jgi:hypothetical protein
VRGVLLRPRAAALGLGALALGGCADRALISGPSEPPGTATWLVVALAAVAIAVVLAALVVLPARRPGGSALASWVLGLQAGGLTVAVAILVGAAIRNEQLIERADAEQAASLLRLSGLDGADGGFFDLIVVVTLLFGGLLVAALVLAARCAADADGAERAMATGVLGIETSAALVCAGFVAFGFRHAAFVLPTLALPLLLAAMVAAWPALRVPEVEAPPRG